MICCPIWKWIKQLNHYLTHLEIAKKKICPAWLVLSHLIICGISSPWKGNKTRMGFAHSSPFYATLPKLLLSPSLLVVSWSLLLYFLLYLSYQWLNHLTNKIPQICLTFNLSQSHPKEEVNWKSSTHDPTLSYLIVIPTNFQV